MKYKNLIFALLLFLPILAASQTQVLPKVRAAGQPQIISLPVLKNVKGEIVTDKNGKSVIIGEGGTSNFTHYTTDNGLALDVVISSYIDHYGNLWFGTAGGGVSRYNGKSFTNYTTAHGLAKNTINCIYEDKAGNMWFGTGGGGVSKFDGKSFQNFNISNGFIHNVVRCITGDTSGDMWFGTEAGVCSYNGTSKSFTNLQELSGMSIRSIVKDKTGTLWFATHGHGIIKYIQKKGAIQDATFTTYTDKDGLASNTILCLYQDKSGHIWAGSEEKGVSCIKTQADNKVVIEYYTTVNGLANNTVLSICEDKQGALWFGTQGGVSRFEEFEDKKNNENQNTAFTSYTIAQGLSNNIIRSILEDKSGNIWLSTYGGGINRYNGKAFINYTKQQGLPGNVIWSVLEDSKGNIWAGTNNNGASCFDGNTFKNYSTEQGLSDNTVWSMYEDRNNTIWFGTDEGGLCIFNGKEFLQYTTDQGLANNTIRCIYEGSDSTVWLGTLGGLSKISKKDLTTKNLRFTNYTTLQGLGANTIWKIFEDSKNNLWIGTFGGGLSKYNKNPDNGKTQLFTNYTTANGLPNNTICSITEDQSGILWIGTAGGGLCRFDGKSFANYNKPQGLPNEVVTQLVTSPAFHTSGLRYKNAEYLIAGTNQGIAVLTGWKATNGKVYPGLCPQNIAPENDQISNELLKSYTPVFEVYNSASGYPVKDVNGGQNAMFRDSKGLIWIATGADKTALVRFNPLALNHISEPPLLVIQGLKINEESVCWNCLSNGDSLTTTVSLTEEVSTFGSPLSPAARKVMKEKFSDIGFDSITPFYTLPQHLVLPFKHNNLTFEFTSIDPIRSNQMQYQYILEGYSKQWSPLSTKTTATFGNIYEGEYTFKLKALSPEGVWSAAASYHFTILPPFYRTWWAYGSYILVSGGTLFLLYMWRTSKLRKDKELLENTVKERTSEIVKQKTLVEEKNVLITDSIEYAQNIQQTILPSEEEIKKHFPEHFILYKPKDIVSGDFYWLYEDKDRILVAVADCTGHGVPGAFMSLMGNNFLNDIINTKSKCSPAEILDELNTRILTSLKQDNNTRSVKYGMDIALISIDKNRTVLEYAGAHSPLLVFRKRTVHDLEINRSGTETTDEWECIQIKANSRSIGSIKKPEDTFTNHTFKLAKGDMLYLYTDGYTDQLGGPERKKFFAQPFRSLLQSICVLPPREQKSVLEQTITDWKGKLNQTDDISVMGIRI